MASDHPFVASEDAVTFIQKPFRFHEVRAMLEKLMPGNAAAA
jgi:hypothetical protein